MKIFIVVIVLSTLSMGLAFAQSSNLFHNTHRFVNNATAFPHVETARHEQPRVKISKTSTISFSEMNEYERAIIAHSFMSSSTSYTHQRMIEGHKEKLNESKTNTASSSFGELNAGDKTTLVHGHVNSAGVEAHQIQAKNLRGLYENKG